MITRKMDCEQLAKACVEYINQELVIPEKGMVDGLEIRFEGLEQYNVTREKVINAINDFVAGWNAYKKYKV